MSHTDGNDMIKNSSSQDKGHFESPSIPKEQKPQSNSQITFNCPKCHKDTLVVSIFGSICSNCFYEPNKSKE